MARYIMTITNLNGLKSHHYFDDKPEERWQGDVLRVEGADELNEGKPLAVYASVRSNQSIAMEEQVDE